MIKELFYQLKRLYYGPDFPDFERERSHYQNEFFQRGIEATQSYLRDYSKSKSRQLIDGIIAGRELAKVLGASDAEHCLIEQELRSEAEQ